MKRLAAVTLVVLLSTASAEAQTTRVARASRIGSISRGRVERALAHREHLALTESQASQLEALRKEEVTRRQDYMRGLIDLESRAAAEQIDVETLRSEMSRLREAAEQSASSVRERVDRILTERQRNQLDREVRFAAPAIRRSALPNAELRRRAVEVRRRALEQSHLRVRPRVQVAPLRRSEELRRQIELLRRRRQGIL